MVKAQVFVKWGKFFHKWLTLYYIELSEQNVSKCVWNDHEKANEKNKSVNP